MIEAEIGPATAGSDRPEDAVDGAEPHAFDAV
jgi:hypothetical protein